MPLNSKKNPKYLKPKAKQILETPATPLRFKTQTDNQTNKQTNKHKSNKQANNKQTNKTTFLLIKENITRNGPFHPLGVSGMPSNSEKSKIL